MLRKRQKNFCLRRVLIYCEANEIYNSNAVVLNFFWIFILVAKKESSSEESSDEEEEEEKPKG